MKLPGLLLVIAAACAPQHLRRPSASVDTSPIDTALLRAHTRFLAHDNLAGRRTGTREADVAALYIQSACMAQGLVPVAGDQYLQPVTLRRTGIAAQGTTLTFSGPGGVRTYEYRAGFLPNIGFDESAGFTAPAVFAGTSEQIGAGRLADLDLRGAAAIVAGPVTDAADDSLSARRAAALIQLTSDEAQYALYVRSRGDTRLRLDDSTAGRSVSASMMSIVASPALSRDIAARVSGSAPEQMAESITLRLSLDRSPVRSSNVACVLRGTDPRAQDSAIAYTAHYDHLGVGIPDQRGDSVYNGFSDNAAGVAMLLGIADAFRRFAPPRHSVLLLFFTGEEQGLLGSDFYVAHPLWPLKATLGVINLDAGAPPARPWSWRLAGERTSLTLLAQDVALDHGWNATTSPATPNSDYYPFAKAGVPAIFIVPGSAPYQGLSSDSTQTLRRKWDHYHEPGDEWAADFPFAGVARYAEYAYLIGRAMDDPSVGIKRTPLPPPGGRR